jgi:hypothetical protein
MTLIKTTRPLAEDQQLPSWFAPHNLLTSEIYCFVHVHILLIISLPLLAREESGSSGSIVSGYRLDDRTFGVRSPAGAKYFSSNLCVQTGSGVHPASCTMGTLSQGVKRGRGVILTTHPHLVQMSGMCRSYISSLPKRHHGL